MLLLRNTNYTLLLICHLMTDQKNIVNTVRQKLTSLSDPKTKKSAERFFKEPILVYGVKSAIVQKLAKDTWKQIKDLDKKTIF